MTVSIMSSVFSSVLFIKEYKDLRRRGVSWGSVERVILYLKCKRKCNNPTARCLFQPASGSHFDQSLEGQATLSIIEVSTTQIFDLLSCYFHLNSLYSPTNVS